MTRRHRNPFIPHERAQEMEEKTDAGEKEAKRHFTREQAKFRKKGAPEKHRVKTRARIKKMEANRAAKPPDEE